MGEIILNLDISNRTHACENERVIFTCNETGREQEWLIDGQSATFFDNSTDSELPDAKFDNTATSVAVLTHRTNNINGFRFTSLLIHSITRDVNVSCITMSSGPGDDVTHHRYLPVSGI